MDYLSDHHFPVEHTMIVGVDLRLVERVLGRQTYLRAMLMGAAAGAWWGLLVGLFLAVFATPFVVYWLPVIAWGVIWGLITGAVFGLISHALTGGWRDFVSYGQIIADRYEVLVEAAQADRARELLERSQ